ncbi:hypothetical protein BKE38_01465 [Pseudoroseomonas deserti]|uniref:DUF1918 domain-containing protein n=1 Tax=Teichococcus deserti TaxID=1817963 RepID=A0A1V2H8F7_9PROT|nr:hypothetical protein [Pseudoroseomonas deserti]ONG58898.1 hypothetical protein BKE38_01465 [Pseudoroseomonas deserti]
MQPHGFSVGQVVEVHPGKHEGHVPGGIYTVERLLPNEGTDREYRVRNQKDGHERVVRESQLRRGASPVTP